MPNYVGGKSVTSAVSGKNAQSQSHMDKIYSQNVHDPNTQTHTHIFTHSGVQHMARTTQEGAASLKIMKIPRQLGAAQQAEAT